MITFSGGKGVKTQHVNLGGHTTGGGGLVAKSCPTLMNPEGCDSEESDGLQSMGLH